MRSHGQRRRDPRPTSTLPVDCLPLDTFRWPGLFIGLTSEGLSYNCIRGPENPRPPTSFPTTTTTTRARAPFHDRNPRGSLSEHPARSADNQTRRHRWKAPSTPTSWTTTPTPSDPRSDRGVIGGGSDSDDHLLLLSRRQRRISSAGLDHLSASTTTARGRRPRGPATHTNFLEPLLIILS